MIVPVRNGRQYLAASLGALRASKSPPGGWELIVVDDSSSDGSAETAACYADAVIRLRNGPCGPGVARNCGVEVARGAILLFVDADVCVHADALRLVAETFESETDIGAVFGAYDLMPAAEGLISQYRNLLHHYVHQREAGDVVTFWAGCGAIRAEVFSHCRGFDEDRGMAALEDIELGYRMSAHGYRIVLRPQIQGTHLKRWTLRSMIVTDVRDRGIPWVRLLISQKRRPTATLNVGVTEQLCTGLMVVACLSLALVLWSGAVAGLAVGVLAIVAILAINSPLLLWFARQRGWSFAVSIVPLRLLYYGLNVVSVGLALLPFGYAGPQKPSPVEERLDLVQRFSREPR